MRPLAFRPLSQPLPNESYLIIHKCAARKKIYHHIRHSIVKTQRTPRPLLFRVAVLSRNNQFLRKKPAYLAAAVSRQEFRKHLATRDLREKDRPADDNLTGDEGPIGQLIKGRTHT